MTGMTTTSMAQPLLDLERLIAGIRWRRRTWMSLALLGLFAGVLLTILFPPPPTAVARLLVVRADAEASAQSSLMETDVALCQTSQVAAAALKQINVIGSPGGLLAAYSCAGVTPSILAITAWGSGGSDAVRRAQALADAFIADHLRRTQEAVDAQVKPLLDRRARLESTLAVVNKTISSTTNPAQLDALNDVRTGLSSQVLDLEKRAEDARIGAPAVAAGTRLLDPPRVVAPGGLTSVVTKAVVGLVLGLGVGLAVAAVLCVTGDRPILRRDIAAELGVSIIAQLPRPPHGPRRLWRRSPHVRERRRVAATLAHIARSADTSISLLEIGCPGTAAPLALDIAEQVASQRPVVVVADLSRGGLRQAGQGPGGVARIVDVTDLPLDPPPSARRPELYLGVGSVGPGTSWVDLGRLGTETLLVVRAGYATTSALHTIARQLAHSEIAPIGVVLIHPDPKDRSDGTLWDGLHTVLRGRHVKASSPPVPGQRPVPSDNGLPVLEPSAAPDEK
jgi:hypothetical protein